MKIAILGTGSVGTALDELLTRTGGHDVALGSRTPDGRAVGHAAAVEAADVVVVAVPYTAALDVLRPLADRLVGKTLVDATNPLDDDWSPLDIGGRSAAETLEDALPGVHVVKAFNTVFADVMSVERLDRDGRPATAFVAGDDAAARERVAALAASVGFDPVVVGALSQARYLEAMAHLNIGIALGQGGGTDAAFVYARGGAPERAGAR